MTASPRELFGTDEPAPERRGLKAGPLSAVLEEGNLRDISWHGVEAVRAVSYLARDTSWGTYKAEISGLEVREEPDGFTVAYDGLCAGPEGRFRYRMTVRGEAAGTLVMEARGEAETDFPTNRTGFVVLHPAEAAGGRLTVRHTDGREEETAFPQAISPDQPAFDIAALTHEPAPGLFCRVEMEGDAFEMEDQRNWSDASFKTYVRPLSKPRPYVIPQGAEDFQRVTVRLQGQAPAAGDAEQGRAALRLGREAGRVPELALFFDAQEPVPAGASAFAGTAGFLIARFDAQAEGGAERLREAAAFANELGAGLAVEVIFDARDPQAEARSAASAIHEAGLTPAALLASPRREFKTRASNSLPEGEHGTAALVDALRKALPGVPVGAGTPSFFTEFNRNPPEAGADFAFFGTSAVVHAADDVSVVETASVVPAVIESARKLAPGLPLWLGPCLIGMRHNPYGAAPAENPHGGRVPMARSDPRHGALFGAAWALTVAAHAAGGVERLTLAAPTGPFGLVGENGERRPLFGLHEMLSLAGGAPRLEVSTGHPSLAALAWRDGSGVRLLLSSLAPEPVTVESPPELQSVAVLAPDGCWGGASPLRGAFTLRPYRTVLLS